MSRALCTAIFGLAIVAGCRLPPERLPPKPLPENMAPLPYAELLTRARLQASAATEAFYISRWSDLEDAAKGLEQTARFMDKAVEVPAKRRETLAADSAELKQVALKLVDAAKAQDVKQSNELLQRVNLRVRELRLE